jgi:hypothetical protein
MAINNTQNTYANMEFPLAMKRQDAFALDPTGVWPSLEAAEDYAKNNPTAYVGQHLSVVADGISTAYQIKDTAGNLEELGAGAVDVATDEEVREMFDEVFGAKA